MELNEPAGLPDGRVLRRNGPSVRPGHYILSKPLFINYHTPFSEKGGRKGAGSYSYIGAPRTHSRQQFSTPALQDRAHFVVVKFGVSGEVQPLVKC